MGVLSGKKILIFQQRGWAISIGRFLARRLQADGCRLAAVTSKKLTHQYTVSQKEVAYDHILNIDEILDGPEKNLAGEDISLEEICCELNIDSIWPMLHSNRFLVRSYKDKYYYGYRQNVSDEHMVSYIKAYYKRLSDLFRDFKPDLILVSAFISEEQLMLKLLADKYKIPVVAVMDAKVPGYYVFAHDHLCRQSPLIDRFHELQNNKSRSPNLAKAKNFISEFRREFKKPVYASEEEEKTLLKKIRHHLSPLRRIIDFYTKPKVRANHLKSIGPTIDYRPPGIILRDFWCHKKYAKFADNYKYYHLEKIEKGVFFPLKFTPEGNIDLMCPLYNNQIELARQVAMSLPGDYTLVAKDHWAMLGLRTPSYLEKVAKTPNVKLIDYRISAEEVLKKVDLIISTYSTVFFEAAFFYKPVVMLGASGIFELLPNVFRHDNLYTLSAKIKEVLKINLRTEQYERQLENFVAAVYDTGFDYNYMAAWERSLGSREELWQIYKKEIERSLLQ